MSNKMIIVGAGKTNNLAKSFIEATPYMNKLLESFSAIDIQQKKTTILINKPTSCGPTEILTRHIEYKTPEIIIKNVPEYILKSVNEVKNEI